MSAITFPRKRHCHRCPLCRNSVACYKKQCSKGPRITVNECPWHRPARSPYAEAPAPNKWPAASAPLHAWRKAPQFELPGAEAAFNLAGEQTIDGEKVQRENEAAAEAAAEARRKQEREQMTWPGFGQDWR